MESLLYILLVNVNQDFSAILMGIMQGACQRWKTTLTLARQNTTGRLMKRELLRDWKIIWKQQLKMPNSYSRDCFKSTKKQPADASLTTLITLFDFYM